jgi:hypothetical protein
MYQCSGYASGSGTIGMFLDLADLHPDPLVRAQRYGSDDPDTHLDPYQNVTDPEHRLVDKRTNTGEQSCVIRLIEFG